MLTYHKIGARPRRVRLKGLYVSCALFNRQVAELSDAGYSTATPAVAAAPGKITERRVVLTFDDGFENVFREALPTLGKYRFSAIQFLVSDLLGKSNIWEQSEGEVAEKLMTTSQIREWLAEGHRIGGHTRSHPRLSRIPIKTAREEISGCRKELQDTFGVPVDDFCYPYGDWSPAIRDLVEEAGFKTACTTQPGINRPPADPYLLLRFTARYASRNWQNFFRTLGGVIGRGQSHRAHA
jgi:peptidoglycan/xylan/chitin deacetylase (PgdA/CDA1 family)